MQPRLTRMFERHARRYLFGCTAVLTFATVLVLVPVGGVFPAHYEKLSLGAYVVLVTVTGSCAVVALAASLLTARSGVRALLIWADRRDPDTAAEARIFAFDGPRMIGLRVMAFGALFTPLIVVLIATPVDHTTALDWVELSLGTLAAVVLAGFNAWFSLDIILHPVRATFDGPAPGARPTSVVGRLALVVPVAIWVAAIGLGFTTTTRDRAGAGHLLVIYGLAFASFAVSMAIVGPLFAGGVVGPMRELAKAMREVSAGRVQARVPIVATDELGRLATAFNQMLEQLQASRARIVTAADTARRDVERDLHDGAQQRLVLLKLKLGMLERDPTRTELIAEIAAELDAALAELRNLARGIYPQRLESDGLAGALADAVEQAALPATLECDGAGRYRREVEAAVYFCCLEALQNAGKHAGPDARASVRLSDAAGALEFEVADDGTGFDTSSGAAGAGLQNMTDRIGALGGELHVRSDPGGGTTIAGTVPLTR